MSEFNTFEYVQLSEVDPNFADVEPGVYNMKILAAEKVNGVTKAGPNQGKAYERISLQYAISGHEKFSGRRMFDSLFPNEYTFKILRRLSDNTGIAQEPGEPIESWLKKLSTVQPTVKLFVDTVPDVSFSGVPNEKNLKSDGTPGNKTVINYKKGISPGD